MSARELRNDVGIVGIHGLIKLISEEESRKQEDC